MCKNLLACNTQLMESSLRSYIGLKDGGKTTVEVWIAIARSWSASRISVVVLPESDLGDGDRNSFELSRKVRCDSPAKQHTWLKCLPDGRFWQFSEFR